MMWLSQERLRQMLVVTSVLLSASFHVCSLKRGNKGNACEEKFYS